MSCSKDSAAMQMRMQCGGGEIYDLMYYSELICIELSSCIYSADCFTLMHGLASAGFLLLTFPFSFWEEEMLFYVSEYSK